MRLVARTEFVSSIALAFVALGCESTPAAATAAASRKDDGTTWTPTLELIELDHSAGLPDDDAAILLRFYDRVHGIRLRARTQRTFASHALRIAKNASPSEEVFALAYPVVPARKPVLFALSQDPNHNVRVTAGESRLLNGVWSKLPAPDSGDVGSFKGALDTWKSFRAFPNPGAAEAFLGFIASKAHPYLRDKAVLALAAADDLRAVPLLADVLGRPSPKTSFSRSADQDREEAADAIEELALAHPNELDVMREQLEQPLAHWLQAAPVRYPGGAFAAAALRSQALLPELRTLAFPRLELPGPDAAGRASLAFLVARVAMRYIARLHDEASFSDLVRQLERRPREIDMSEPKVEGAVGSPLETAVNTLAVGAAEALGAWGDRRATAPLLAHAREHLNNQTSRVVALRAVVQLTPENELPALLDAALKQLGVTGSDGEVAYGILQAFELRPIKFPKLWTLLAPGTADGVRVSAAHVLGLSGLTTDEQNTLLGQLANDDPKRDPLGTSLRAWIVMLGGDDKAASAALKALPGTYAPDSEIATLWASSLPSIGQEELESGRLFRIVRNGIAAAREVQSSGSKLWPTQLLTGTFGLAGFGRDARELPRPALRRRLMELGRHGSPEQVEGAAWTLALMYERGFLMELLHPNPGGLPSVETQRRDAVRRALRFLDSGLRTL